MTRHIIDYEVIVASNGTELNMEICEFLELNKKLTDFDESWEPFGGPSVAISDGIATIAQGMALWKGGVSK